jgi:ribosomal protein S27AE
MKNKKCVICGEGTYVDLSIADPTDLHNAGIGAKFVGRTAWHASECNNCGNVQMFRYERTEEQMRGM